MRRTVAIIAGVVVVLVVAGGASAALIAHAASQHRARATAAARAYLLQWQQGHLPGDPLAGLHLPSGALSSVVTAVHGSGPYRVDVRTTVALPGTTPWVVPATLTVRGSAVVSPPEALVPGDQAGDRVQLKQQAAAPGPVLGRDGSPLAPDPQLAALFTGYHSAQRSGTARTLIRVVTAAGAPVATLLDRPAVAGTAVPSTADGALQHLAEQLTAGSGHPAAMVAIDTTTGGVLAAASSPATGYDRALLGRYPPGSTFKIVTLLAALSTGHPLTELESCTPTVTIDGYSFHNASGEAFGAIPLLTAFAVSCNTAFVNLAEKLPHGALADAARTMGCDIGHAPLPAPSFGCSFPATATGTGYAAASFGQGTVSASPLAMAAMAAAVQAGTWQQPHLDPGSAPLTHALPPAALDGLRAAMRAVVTTGTGAPANLPGEPIFGKTGTAEHGTGANPPTDAWFAAYRGHVAVAVVVEDAGFGETAAVPLAARFLTSAG